MSTSLHDSFTESEKKRDNPDIHSRHPASGDIIHQCKEILYNLPAGRHLIEFMNTRQIPASVEQGERISHRVINRASIILTCPNTEQKNYTALTLHLAAALREIEFHTPDYRPPEMKDSQNWLHAHLAEPFEIMLTLCRVAFDMQFNGPSDEVESFLKDNDLAHIYHAYENKHPQEKLEALMQRKFNERH